MIPNSKPTSASIINSGAFVNASVQYNSHTTYNAHVPYGGFDAKFGQLPKSALVLSVIPSKGKIQNVNPTA